MNNDGAPNARIVKDDDNVKYEHGIGGSLKVRYLAERKGGWIQFNPANLHVEFNGHKVEFLQELKITIDPLDGFPKATLSFKLDKIDIDMDSLIILEAIVKQQEEEITIDSDTSKN